MGIAERKRREREIRTNLIRDSAAGVFYRKGYHGTTMEEIAALAEVSKATVYLYFRSKEDLYFSIVEPALHSLGETLAEIAGNESESADATIRRIVEATYAFYLNAPDAYRLISRYKASEFSKLLSENKLDCLKKLMRTNLMHLERTLVKGVSQGIFKEMDPVVTAVIFWNAFMGVIQYQENRMDEGRSDYRKSTLDAAVHLILRGLGK